MRCPACKYEVDYGLDRCPECGRVASSADRAMVEDRRWFRWIGGATVVGLCGLAVAANDAANSPDASMEWALRLLPVALGLVAALIFWRAERAPPGADPLRRGRRYASMTLLMAILGIMTYVFAGALLILAVTLRH